MKEFESVYFVLNSNNADKVNKFAKKNNIYKTTTFFAKGTINNKVLKFFELHSFEKEVVLIVDEKEKLDVFKKKVVKHLSMDKKNQGIYFSILLNKIISTNYNKDYTKIEEENMYSLITVIVEKGKGEEVVTASKVKGSKGATIINARGSSAKETQKVFNILIEPEKEIVLILVKKELVNDICNNIETEFEISKPGNGILFVQEVNEVYGIIE